MNELMKIVEVNNQEYVSARELMQFLELKERFSKWFDRMLQFGFVRGEDYTPYQKVHPQNNGNYTDYFLTLDMGKELSMLARNEQGKKARRYFIDVEKRARAITFKELPQTYSEALRELASTVEQNEQLKLEQLQNAPKIELAEQCLRRETEMSITDAGKHLNLSQKEIFKIMRENKYLTKKRLPSQKALDRNVLTLKTDPLGVEDWRQSVMTMENIMNFQKRHMKSVPVQGNLIGVIDG